MDQHLESDLTGTHLWLLLWRAMHSLQEHSNRSIARFDMGVSDFGVLEALLHRGPLTMKELGAKVLLTSGSMTAAVDRLERRGLVMRADDRRDRRACLVELTQSGRQLIEDAFPQHREAMEAAVNGFSEAQRAELLPLLRQLGKTAESNLAHGELPGRGQKKGKEQ